MKSIFTGKVMETKWICGRMSWWSSKEGEWQHTLPFPTSLPQQCNRILERSTIHTTNLDFIMEANDIYVHEDKKYTIERIEYNSDNSITYHTDYVVSDTTIRSYEDAMKELCEQRKLKAEKLQKLENNEIVNIDEETKPTINKRYLLLEILTLILFFLGIIHFLIRQITL